MEYAKPEWRNGQPYNTEFNDVYFSAQSGIEETEHVFIRHNQLIERFSHHRAEDRPFVIAETGFGSGLNFLLTVKHWLEQSDSPQCLMFYSAEKTPFTLDDLRHAHEAWPALAEFASELQSQYQIASYGYHLLELFAGRVKLVLMIGEVEQMLAQCEAAVDAWFLDGFAPSLNASMWNEQVFAQIQRLSRPGTTFSTYTAVGDVRRGLMSAGFKVEKVDGCGQKRHMLRGEYALTSAPGSSDLPWFSIPLSECHKKKHICIIGAGIAGLTTAWAMVKRGYRVSIIEQAEHYGAQASGNPHAMLMPRLSLQDSADAEFYTSAYFYALRCLHYLNERREQGQAPVWQQTGGIQLPSTARIKKQMAEYPQTDLLAQVLDATQATIKAGLPIDQPVHYFPLAASLQPVKVLQRLIAEMGNSLSIRYATEVSSFSQQHGQWQLYDAQGELIQQADCLICCTAWQAKRFAPFQSLYLQPARGQLSVLEASPQSRRLRLPLSYEGYLMPSINDEHVAGASFQLDDCATEIRMTEHMENLAAINTACDNLFKESAIKGGRASIRAVTPDRMPVVGPAFDQAKYLQDYADLYKAGPAGRYVNATYLSGLYINSGHGARGFTSAFMCAEYLAAMICDEPLPVANRVRYALHPARFLIRNLKKNQYKKQ